MLHLPGIFSRFTALFRRTRHDAEMSAELQGHIEALTERNVAGGMSPDEARYAALREFGGVEQIKERCRDEHIRGFLWLEQTLQDLRYAGRTLRKNASFTAVVASTLAMGIGLNTVAFSLYRAVVAKPLAVRHPDEILRLSSDRRQPQAPFTDEEFEVLRRESHSLASVVAVSPLQVVLAARTAAASEPQEPASVQLVSDNFFSALGVTAILGRALAPGDTAAAVLSYDGWQRRFNGDPGVIGRTAVLHGVPVMIAGVTPASFGGIGAPPAVPDFWVPMALQPQLVPPSDWLHDPTQRAWTLLGRRKPELAASDVNAELAVIARHWPQRDGQIRTPGARRAMFFELNGPEVHAVFITLLVAVSLMLLVGCINVLNLLQARGTAREHEFAVRLALGASRGRLMRQLCTESITLGLLGGAAGLLLAWWSCGIIHAFAMTVMREFSGGTWSLFVDLTPDWHVFAFTLAVAATTGLLVGLRPAWHSSRADIEKSLKQRSAGLTRAGGRGRNVLLTIQVAASLCLLAGAGLLLRGAARAVNLDPGFDAKHLLVVAVWANVSTEQPDRATQLQRARLISDRLQSLPEIVSAAAADHAPFMGHSLRPYVTDENRWVHGCATMEVDDHYFATLGLGIVNGRNFTPAEVTGGSPVAVISESAARQFWPGHDPVGRHFSLPKRAANGAPTPQYEVIGVVKDARLTLLSKTDAADVFLPQAATAMWLVRTHGPALAAVSSVYTALRDVTPTTAAQSAVITMEQGPMHLQLLMARLPAQFASLLGALALILATVGVYGIVSFTVVRRTREIGVRLALGAEPRDVVWLMIGDSLRPALWGAVLGLTGATALTVLLLKLVVNPELPDFTYGAAQFPLPTLAAVVGILAAALLGGALVPALRAAKVDPIATLRAE